ncbi:MAG: hypothetical protein LBV16_05460 [Elusimicrobiota bacterium]|jgi:hypothetical protein|nr:hypothetical protein [Elusimicrobiota bacterium]
MLKTDKIIAPSKIPQGFNVNRILPQSMQKRFADINPSYIAPRSYRKKTLGKAKIEENAKAR